MKLFEGDFKGGEKPSVRVTVKLRIKVRCHIKVRVSLWFRLMAGVRFRLRRSVKVNG